MDTVPLVDFNTNYYRYPNNIGDNLSAGFELGAYASIHDDQINETVRLSGTRFHQMVSAHFAASTDDELLKSNLSPHGVFARRFFAHDVRQRVARRFAEANIDLREFSRLLWEAWERDTANVIDDVPWAIEVIIAHLYDQAFIRVTKDQRTMSELETWFRRFARPRGCILCGRMYRVIDLPDWIYFGSNACIDCCFTCPMECPDKEELQFLVPAFVQACEFIPSSNATPINYAFCSRLSQAKKQDVFRAYARMGGIEHVKRKFASWFHALAETGALPGGVLPTTRGVKCLARDGHACHSLDEQRIDDWLSGNAIPHQREPYYPEDSLLNQAGNRRADWRVGEAFIEYFGLVGEENYDKKISEKILLAQHHGINLVTIYPADLQHLDSVLNALRADVTGSAINISAEASGKYADKWSSTENQQPVDAPQIKHEAHRARSERRAASTSRQQRKRQTEESGIPVRWIEGIRLQEVDTDVSALWRQGSKLEPAHDGGGKALYHGRDGWAVTIEQLALEFYGQLGYAGRWTENVYWWGIMALLFWDVIYAQLPGVFGSWAPFPSHMQDAPHDFFSSDFYGRRKDLIAERMTRLTKPGQFGLGKPNIESELRNAFRRYHDLPYRPALWTEKFTEDDITAVARTLTEKQLMMIMLHLLEDFGGNRTGMPDLFIVRSDTPLLVEVKSARERLRNDQIAWLMYLQNDVGLPVEICRVAQTV